MRFYSTTILASFLSVGFLWTILILYFYSDPVSAHHYYLLQQCQSEAIADRLARKDFEEGRYFIVLSSGIDTDRHLKRAAWLKGKYNITVIPSGCVATPELFHYSDVMMQLISQKHGHDFRYIVDKYR